MSYLLSQIWVCLFLTALVAGIAGWLLARSNNKELRDSLQVSKADNASLKKECDYYISELENKDDSPELFYKSNSLVDNIDASEKVDTLEVDASHTDLVHELDAQKKINTSLQNKVEEQQEFFIQRTSELEAGSRLANAEKDEYSKQLMALRSEIKEVGEELQPPIESHSLPELTVGQDCLKKNVDLSSAPVVSMEKGTNDGDYSMADLSTPSSKVLKKLSKNGIKMTSDLLVKAYDFKSITVLAKKIDKEPWNIRSLVSVSDLLRIEGLSPVNAELLELAGIGRVQDLRRLNASKLLESINVINRHENKTDKLPSQEEVSQWMALAEKLEPAVSTDIDRI
ncbi:MAG: DUF4332 domain-containing protein [Thiotrichaceae bacterium]|nr:DUF4332 domain-containing protein [Thiotrichaceae bacterium]